jgi:ubiquitin carboxyl-terminal hydrolase 25/28
VACPTAPPANTACAGKTAPRLLQDLSSYDPRFEAAAGRNLLTSAPPQHDDTKPKVPAVPRKNCRHALVLKKELSQLPTPGQKPDRTIVYKVASYCQSCHWHIDIIVDFRYDAPDWEPCKNNGYLLHHFVFEEDTRGSDESTNTPRTYNFRCSAPPCPVRLQIRLRPPHLSTADVDTLTNPAMLEQRWEVAKQQAGDRADDCPARKAHGLCFLHTYLTNSLNTTKGKTRIPLLNKKFFKTFGQDCDAIFAHFGFTTELEDPTDLLTRVWYPPKLDDVDDAQADALRTTIQDARYELDGFIMRMSDSDIGDAKFAPMYPEPSQDHIARALACDDCTQNQPLNQSKLTDGVDDKAKGRVQTRNTNHEEDHPYVPPTSTPDIANKCRYYAGLGAVGDFSDALILFAYARQSAIDASNLPYYYECLEDLAKGRKSEALDTQVAMLASQGFISKRDVDQAYRYFGIEPAHVSLISDEHIKGVFKSRLSDMGPASAPETRQQLRVLAEARGSELLRAEASDTMETYEQALSWLELELHSNDDYATTMYTIKVCRQTVLGS